MLSRKLEFHYNQFCDSYMYGSKNLNFYFLCSLIPLGAILYIVLLVMVLRKSVWLKPYLHKGVNEIFCPFPMFLCKLWFINVYTRLLSDSDFHVN